MTRCPENARQAAVALVRRDPLARAAPPWPNLAADRLSLWEPIPVGVDENGVQVEISLPERNVLAGLRHRPGRRLGQPRLLRRRHRRRPARGRLVLHEGGQPLRLRCPYLDDAQLADLAQHAEARRRQPNATGPMALTQPVESS